ncbi:hypothetical protein [Lacticaseibacillus kribbianus]|uniref:hypothetical protein n=1 Tax=Lacticaseibacillus kribbianus TaxID=2926292 RepID=UPI001CD1E767|nr:hypothetical protein [Lacticaseibacillus kribbianus]
MKRKLIATLAALALLGLGLVLTPHTSPSASAIAPSSDSQITENQTTNAEVAFIRTAVVPLSNWKAKNMATGKTAYFHETSETITFTTSYTPHQTSTAKFTYAPDNISSDYDYGGVLGDDLLVGCDAVGAKGDEEVEFFLCTYTYTLN